MALNTQKAAAVYLPALLVIGIGICPLLRAEIPITELQGLSICMAHGYESYSPAIGALYWYSPYIRNLYEFGDNEWPMVKLAHELFFIHHDGITFDATRSATKIARYFTPKEIGTIIGYLHKGKENPEDDLQKQLLVQLSEDRGTCEFINVILSSKIPTNDKDRELLKPLYEWVIQNLQKISPSCISIIIESILNIEIPIDAERRAFVQPLYEWVIHNLSKIMPISTYNTIISILNIKIPSDDKAAELVKPMYEWIINTLENSEESFIKDIMRKLFARPLPSTDNERELIKYLYEMIIHTLVPKNPSIQTSVIYSILRMPMPTTDKSFELINFLYTWVINTLPTIQPSDRIDIIDAILKKTIPTNDKELEAVKILYDGIIHVKKQATENPQKRLL